MNTRTKCNQQVGTGFKYNRKAENLGLRLGNATFKEDRSHMSKNPPKTLQFPNPKVVQIGERTPCTML